MRQACIVTMFIGAVLAFDFNNVSLAQYTEFQWVGGTGSQNWQDAANWDLSGFPNETDPNDMDFPTANLSVGLGANLNVTVGTTPVTIAGLTLGGTASAVTTEISSGGPNGILTFRNDNDPNGLTNSRDSDFDNDTLVSGLDFLIWQANHGATNLGDDYNDKGDAVAERNNGRLVVVV